MRYRLTPPKPPKQVENDVESAILDFLRLRGYFPVRIHCGKFWTLDKMRILTGAEKGTPDWAFLHRVYPAFLLEAKRPGGQPTETQREQIKKIGIGYSLEIVVIDDIDKLRPWVDEREERCRLEWEEAR